MAEFGFYLWVWEGDVSLAKRAVQKVRAIYPEHSIYVFSDGSTSDADNDFFYENATLKISNNPKWLHYGDAFLHERYGQLLDMSTENLFIKIDPDTDIHRELTFPDALWFGRVFRDHGFKGVWGCGMGIQRKLLEIFLKNPPTSTLFTYESVYGTHLLSEDTTLGYYLNKLLEIEPVEWLDINVGRVSQNSFFQSNNWSLTHPSLGKRVPNNSFQVLSLETISPTGELLPLETIRSIREELRANSFQGRVSLYGRVDPFLDPRLEEIVEIFADNKGQVLLVSPGDFIDYPKVKNFLNNGLGQLLLVPDSLQKLHQVQDLPEVLSLSQITVRDNLEQMGPLEDLASPRRLLKNPSLDLPCLRPSTMMTVRADGCVNICSSDVNSEIVIGNVKTTSLYDLWYSDIFLDYRERLIANRHGIPICPTCPYSGSPAERAPL